MKLPKTLRRGLRDLSGSQAGRAVLAEGFVAAGAALAASQARSGATLRTLAAANPGARDLADVRAAAALALQEAARSFTEALRRNGQPESTPPTAAPPRASTH